MVAPLTLDQLVGVRVPIPQRICPPFQTEGFLCAKVRLHSHAGGVRLSRR